MAKEGKDVSDRISYLLHLYHYKQNQIRSLYWGYNYLAKRLFQHSENIRLKKKTFASRYKCSHLLYYEKYTWIQEAIAREKEIKGWSRQKKIELIKTVNPNMDFLEHLFPYDRSNGY